MMQEEISSLSFIQTNSMPSPSQRFVQKNVLMRNQNRHQGQILFKFPSSQSLILGFVYALSESQTLPESAHDILLEGATEGLARSGMFIIPNAYLRLDKDSIVTIVLPVLPAQHHLRVFASEIVAAAMDIDIRKVRFETIPHSEYPIRTQICPGSRFQAHECITTNLLYALTVARLMLLQAAALRWNLSVEQCTTNNGHVQNATTQDYLHYSEIISDVNKLSLPLVGELTIKQA